MDLSEKLIEIENRRVSMLNTANEKTGANDITLSDAVNTLVGGFGSGGGSVETQTITVKFIDGTSVDLQVVV